MGLDMQKHRTTRMGLGVMVWAAVTALAIFAASGTAQAADDEAESGVIYQKKTTVNFDEDTIDGDLTRPDGAYVESRKRVRHSNLIRIREDFREKVLYSVSGL